MRYVNLRFFGGGGGESETTTVRKRDPEDPQLTALRNQIASSLNGVYSGNNYATDYAQAKSRANQAYGNYDLMSSNLLNATNRENNTADELHNVASTGNISQALTDSLNKSVNRAMNLSFGTTLNDLANKGIVNSSVTNRSINNIEDSAANAYNQNYLTAYNDQVNNLNTALGGYNTLANQYNTAMQTYSSMPSQIWKNLSAAYEDPYQFWKDWQNSYDNREDYDTVVTQDSGK